LGAQTSEKQCFLAAITKKHFNENNSLRMLNLRNAASATLESSQHCFLGAQTGKHLLQKQNVCGIKKTETCFVSERLCAQTGKHLGKHASARMFLQQSSF